MACVADHHSAERPSGGTGGERRVAEANQLTPMKTQTNNAVPPVPLARLVHRLRRWMGADIPTRNPGTASAPEDEVLKTLKSIDASLKTLAGAVRNTPGHGHGKSHLATGHWNDSHRA